ncbi:MAG: mevalonate kinase [Candidatus Bathyarchaeia archaeon]
MEMAVEASAPGKIILFGEHSVVYRGPAIAIAIDRRARVTAEERGDKKIFIEAVDLGVAGFFEEGAYKPVKGGMRGEVSLRAIDVSARHTMGHIGRSGGVSLRVSSEIPIAVGLGSSAAICVATVAALGELLGGGLSKEEICNLAFEGERIIHGSPSGIDNNVSTHGGVLRYERGEGYERFAPDVEIPLIVGNTGLRRSTRRMVEKVRGIWEKEGEIVDGIIDLLGHISTYGLDSLLKGDLQRMGTLMNISHGLLSSLGVSCPELDLLVYAARSAGAMGAKLTGAGGGGCMVALATENRLGKVEEAIASSGGEPIRVRLSSEGVTVRRVT